MLDALGEIFLNLLIVDRSSIGPFDAFYILAVC